MQQRPLPKWCAANAFTGYQRPLRYVPVKAVHAKPFFLWQVDCMQHDPFPAGGCLYRHLLCEQISAQIWRDILSGAAEEQPHLLQRFLLLVHGDLKHFVFTYWWVAEQRGLGFAGFCVYQPEVKHFEADCPKVDVWCRVCRM